MQEIVKMYYKINITQLFVSFMIHYERRNNIIC